MALLKKFAALFEDLPKVDKEQARPLIPFPDREGRLTRKLAKDIINPE